MHDYLRKSKKEKVVRMALYVLLVRPLSCLLLLWSFFGRPTSRPD